MKKKTLIKLFSIENEKKSKKKCHLIIRKQRQLYKGERRGEKETNYEKK